ncbi:hypothetical protein LRC484719_07690 [Mycobacterium riyadhense]
MSLAAVAEHIGNPDIALAIDVDAVRKHQHPGAKAPQQLSVRVELQDRIERRSNAGKGHAGWDPIRWACFPATLGDPYRAAVGIDSNGA